MPSTLVSLIVAVAVVLPGFVTVELTQRQRAVLVHLKGDTPQAPRVVLGRYGKGSAAGQSPAEHDLFLQEMWSVDQLGHPVARLEPPRGMWIAKEAIAELYFLDGDPTASGRVVSDA